MQESSRKNKTAWEFDAYDFWIRQAGTPEERARQILTDPARPLRFHKEHFRDCRGLRVANICGSCGKKAVPLAVMGAEVTVFDISEANRRYALELATAAQTEIAFEVCDVMAIDLARFGGSFDMVYMEGGVLHYFHDLPAFMRMMHALLRSGGCMICSDFHPLTKVLDVLGFQQPTRSYFDTGAFEAEMPHARFYDEETRRLFPTCSLRKYTMSDIVNAVIGAGFVLRRLDEHPAWTDGSLPGEFTILADAAGDLPG